MAMRCLAIHVSMSVLELWGWDWNTGQDVKIRAQGRIVAFLQRPRKSRASQMVQW